MGQYKHPVEVGAARIVDEHLVQGQIVQDYLYIAPPGDNKFKPDEGD